MSSEIVFTKEQSINDEPLTEKTVCFKINGLFLCQK